MIECPHCRTPNADIHVICKNCGYSLSCGESLPLNKQEKKEINEKRRRALMQERWIGISGTYIEASMLAINVCAFIYGLEFSSMRYLVFVVEALAIIGLLMYFSPFLAIIFVPVSLRKYLAEISDLDFVAIKCSGLLLYALGMWGILILSTMFAT